jgi:hypothetical protein
VETIEVEVMPWGTAKVKAGNLTIEYTAEQWARMQAYRAHFTHVSGADASNRWYAENILRGASYWSAKG